MDAEEANGKTRGEREKMRERDGEKSTTSENTEEQMDEEEKGGDGKKEGTRR